MLEGFSNNIFEYKKLTPEEQKSRGILGRLVGVIADAAKPTRNGRSYSKALWEKVFSDDVVKEKVNSRCVFGELGHPADRQEIDMEKAAICLAEMPKWGKDNKLYGVFDIINTPNGQILKTLCDYGCNIGISSRGSGDVISDFDGGESVDPDTYTFECFDAVLVPAVKEARLKLVTESVGNKTLTESLHELVENQEDLTAKRIMQDTVRELNLQEDTKDVLQTVVDHFGMVSEPYQGPTYILPSGLLLDLSKVDHHSDVEKYLIDNKLSTNEYVQTAGSKTMFDLGAIRCDTSKYYIALCDKQPTREQYNSLLVWLDYLCKTTSFVEVITPDNQHITYNLKEIIPDYVVDRIRRYYSSGTLYEKLNQKHQHGFLYKRSPLGEGITTDSDKQETVLDKSDIEQAGEVANDKSIAEEYQEMLKRNRELEATVTALQEKLSVCYAKEAKNVENIEKYKSTIVSMGKTVRESKALEAKVSNLNEKLESKNNEISKYSSQSSSFSRQLIALREDVDRKDKRVAYLEKKNKALQESVDNSKAKEEKLTEQVAELNKDLAIKAKEYTAKLKSNNELIEKYKRIASKSVEKYIDSQALRIGVTSNEIKNRLPESYSFDDIDSICEDLQNYQVNINSLPFAVGKQPKQRIVVESTQSQVTQNPDDIVDKSFLRMFGIEH